MATYRFELEGADELEATLKRAGDRAGHAIGQAIYEEALTIFNQSQILVPVDTGALRGSGGVSAPQNTADGVAVDIFYGGPAAPYALYVHEIQDNYHEPPTQAKYLEQPLMARLPEISRNLARRIISIINTGR